MVDGNTGFTIERDLQATKIKLLLENWQEIILILNNLLLWKKKFYPWVIVAVTTYVFITFASYSPSFLTSVGLISLVATLVDYVGPSVSVMIWRQEDWNSSKQKEFEDVCKSLAAALVYVKQSWAFIMDLKTTKPVMYFMVTIVSSLSLALIGNSVNNIAILYFISLGVLMLPGLVHYGIIQKYYSIGLTHIVGVLRTFNSSISKTKTH